MERYTNYTCYADGKYYTTVYSYPSYEYDGPYYTQVAHTNYTTCSTGYAGHSYSRKTYANATISGGVDMPFVDVSAQADWSSSMKCGWQFSSSRGGKLCGSNPKPWTQTPYVSGTA